MFESKPVAVAVFFAVPTVVVFVLLAMYDAKADTIMNVIVSVIVGGVIYGIASSFARVESGTPTNRSYQTKSAGVTCPNCGAQLDPGVLASYSSIAVGSIRCGGCGKSFSADALRARSVYQGMPQSQELSVPAVALGFSVASFGATIVMDRLVFLVEILTGLSKNIRSFLPMTPLPISHWLLAVIPFLIWFFKQREEYWWQGLAVWFGGYFVASVIDFFIVGAIYSMDSWVSPSTNFLLVCGGFLLAGSVLLWLGFKRLKPRG